jgi:hypothetical protein
VVAALNRDEQWSAVICLFFIPSAMLHNCWLGFCECQSDKRLAVHRESCWVTLTLTRLGSLKKNFSGLYWRIVTCAYV